MKKIALAASVSLLVGVGLVGWKAQSGAQAVPILNQATVAWDAVTTDVNGNPETIRDAELGIWPASANHLTVDPMAVLSALPAVPPVGGVPISGIVAGRPDGDYRLAVRVYDAAGNASGWSNAVIGRIDMTPPSKPAGFRIIVTVQVIPE